ncbi:MAG: sterol desaturase family protein [Sphingobacteriales bacterium]|nr:MAG: sterol desaturase family protein [Sphingobacteriales bacterium]
MHWNYLSLAVPFFIGLMLLEYFISRRLGKNYYQLHSSVANISVGIAERLSDVLIAGAFYFVYDYIQKHYGLFTIKPGIALWILLLLFTDFIWYWYHRLAHEINILWIVHIVHHQSEDYNYTVSARITVFQALVRTAFWSVLPLIGFPAQMITAMLLIHGMYPFFVHTRLIGKLGILEYIFVTPSHHRVHHASNEKYLDKNYGDVLIIWDKLFGTFQKEEEEPTYGLTKPLKTYSFLWQHFHFAIELWLAVKSKSSIKEKWKVITGRPEKLDTSLREKAEALFNIKQAAHDIDQPLNKYVIMQVIGLLASLFIFIALEKYFSAGFKIGFTLLVLLTLINCGAIMEQKRWIFLVESLRLSVLLILFFCFPQYLYFKLFVLLTITTIFVLYYRLAEKRYLQVVYRNR